MNEREELQLVQDLASQRRTVRYRTYLRLSGPGWLQSALSLGGGSLASSLYLGVLAGYSMLWLQPFSMLLGIVMISALGYVTLATRESPVRSISRHINPVLAWSWALASLLASVVWALPQFSLAAGVMQQNLMPGVLGPDGALDGAAGTLTVSLAVLVAALAITWNYGRGTAGVRAYEWILKVVVAVIVLSFVGVVVRLALIAGTLDWSELARGLIPNPAAIFRPAEGFAPLLADLSETSRAFWTDLLVRRQQDVMAAALSSAVGINMTFLFAYTLLRRQWGTKHHGLVRLDLVFGMFLTFTLATSCVLIASTRQFHATPQAGFGDAQVTASDPPERLLDEYNQLLEERVSHDAGAAGLSDNEIATLISGLSQGDRSLAATLVTRDAFDLAASLEPLLGGVFAHIIFGIGVLGMAVSSITLMMVVSGFVLCEMFNKPHTGSVFRLGTLAPALGALGPFLWDRAYFWLAIPTSIITLLLLPIAYITFFLMMNNQALLGHHMPRGRSRIAWNASMALAVALTTTASIYMLWTHGGRPGLVLLGAFLLAIGFAHWRRKRSPAPPVPEDIKPPSLSETV